MFVIPSLSLLRPGETGFVINVFLLKVAKGEI